MEHNRSLLISKKSLHIISLNDSIVPWEISCDAALGNFVNPNIHYHHGSHDPPTDDDSLIVIEKELRNIWKLKERI